jgi:hypothetical protein
MKGIMRYGLIAVFALLLNYGACPVIWAQPLKSPSLSEIVLIGLRPVKELDPANCLKAEQSCVRKYLGTIASDSILWDFDVPFSPDKAISVRRRNLAEQMVAILGRDVRKEAEAFAHAVPLINEWEGMSEGPMKEAKFVDNWLQKRPGAPIASFLHLFKAHRLRAGYEAARANHEKGYWPILARLYRKELNDARSSTNPLIICIADDLDAQSFVYLEGQGRP